MLVPMLVLFLGVDGALAGQILSYHEAEHSRTEAGVPGINVTGGWSWVDGQGQKHNIWYVADTGGFRAFGDLVPGDPQQASTKLAIGTPVLPGAAGTSTTISQPASTNIPALPERRPFTVGTPVLGGPHTPLESSGAHRFSAGSTRREEFADSTQTVKSLGHDVSRQNIDASKAFPSVTGFDSVIPLALPRFIKTSSSNAQESLLERGAGDHQIVESRQRAFTKSVTGQVEKPLLQEQTTQPKESDIHLVMDTSGSLLKSMLKAPTGNRVSQRMQSKSVDSAFLLESDLQNPSQLSSIQQINRDREIPLEVLLPAPAEGSDFVLIDRLRIPTSPKERVGPPQIVPQPVKVKSSSSQVIMGLHTSGRAPMGRRLNQPTSNIAPLGIHLLNLVPFRASNKRVSSTRPVPRPSRITGAPNLENFYRPAQLARTTPSPFRLPNPTRDYDYQYYDYDYYDYANYDSSSVSGGPRKLESGTKSANDTSEESESSSEPDSPDSDESED